MSTPELSFIIVNWNGGDYIRCCIESIFQYPPGIAFDLVVIDNVSTDGSLAYLEQKQKELPEGMLKLVRNRVNNGFSKANNQGFAISRAPLLFLLNPDAELMPGSIDSLLELMKSDERIALCGPRIVNTDGSMQPSVWPNPSTPAEILVSEMHLYRMLPQALSSRILLGGHWDHTERRRVRRLSGAAMLVRRSAIEKAGPLNESFHMYAEDVEWCLRMDRAGFRVIFDPSATVLHHGGQSSLQRWGLDDTLLAALKAYLEYERTCLPLYHALLNTLTRWTATWVHILWRKLRFVQRDGMTVMLERKRALFAEQLRVLTFRTTPVTAPQRDSAY